MKRAIPTALLLSLGLSAAAGAQAPAPQVAEPQDGRAAAYYHFAMGHMYAEIAAAYGYRSEDVDKAIEHYKAAMKADPSASFLSEELTDLYMQSGKLRDAVVEAEDMLKRNPDNIEARRMLARIYARMIGDQRQNRINETMLRNALEQYRKIVEKEPKDVDSWLWLGRLYKVGQDSVESEKAFKKVLEVEPDNEFALSGLATIYSDLGDNGRAIEMWSRLSQQNPSARTLAALAKAYEDAGDHKSAVQTLRRAVDMDQRNVELLATLAKAYEDAGDRKSAAETLRRALEIEPRNPGLKTALAENLLLSDDVDGSLKIYRELADAGPKNARVWLRLSQVYRFKGDFAKAREAQQRAREIEPDDLQIRYNEVSLLEAEGKTAEAIAALKQILDSTESKTYSGPEQANRMILIQSLGVLYRTNEQFAEAVRTFEQMVQTDPDSAPRSAAQIIDTWRQAKEFSKAEQAADDAFKKYPDNRTVKLVRASVLADVGRVDDAVASLKSMLGGKDDRDTQIALAQAYDKAKRFSDEAAALDAAEKLAESSEEKETIFFLRGAMYEKSKQFEKAEAEFRKVLEINPRSASALNYLGYMLADRNTRVEEAHNMIKRALELDPNNGAYLDSLGWVNYRLGRLDEAAANLRAAIARTSRDPVVHDHLGDVYMSQGRVKEAIGQWERSLKEWQASAPSDYDGAEVAKVQKKLETARVRLAKETGAAAR